MLQTNPTVERLRVGFVLDTGPLLIYTFRAWERGRYLERVAVDIPGVEIENVGKAIGELVERAGRIVITPQIITEFQALARYRVGLNEEGVTDFLRFCREILYKMDEKFFTVRELVTLKDEVNLWRLCFTDSSCIAASKYTDLPILTMDSELCSRSRALGIQGVHVYYDYYLSNLRGL